MKHEDAIPFDDDAPDRHAFADAAQPQPPSDPNTPCEDGFGPPSVPTLVHCIHCGEEYDSFRIEWVVTAGHDGKPWGHWGCPVPGCDGAGFGMDIWPVDPDWIDPDDRGFELMGGDGTDEECEFDEHDELDEHDEMSELDEMDELDELGELYPDDFNPDTPDTVEEEQDPFAPPVAPASHDPNTPRIVRGREDYGMRF